MPKHRILVVDGNTPELNERHVAAGGNLTGEHYARVLRSLRSDIQCTVLQAARPGGAELPPGMDLASFSGVAWTGSSLNVYNDTPPVRAQIELARAVFAAGIPQFGSCWGLQVAAVAAGGVVRANPLGRELGIARRILLNKAGIAHPMYHGKPHVFDAIAVHMDEVSELPPNATVLASNAMSTVQAAEIRHQRGVFWGTQYHPEYDLNEIATVMLRHGSRLVDAGFFADVATLQRFTTDLRTLHSNSERRDLAWLYGIGDEVLDLDRHRHELKQWLKVQVLQAVQISS